MNEGSGFSLSPPQVPDYPKEGTAVDVLRWTLAVMDDDDKDIGFAASLLSFVHKHGRLSDKQSLYARRTVLRVKGLWAAQNLKCQRGADHKHLRLVASGSTIG